MEFDVERITKDVVWFGLRATRLNGLARRAICVVMSPPLAERLVQDAQERVMEKDRQMLKGAGELTLQVHQGQVVLDPAFLEPVWSAIKAKKSGILFTEVFDPHEAALLEEITPPVVSPET